MSFSAPLGRSSMRNVASSLTSRPGSTCVRYASSSTYQPTCSAVSALTTAFSLPSPRLCMTPLHRQTSQLAATSTSKLPQRRFASSSTSFQPATSSALEPLTWNRFLALRKTRRRISLGSSIVCAGGVAGVGLSSIMASDFDSTAAATTGFDPIAILGLSSAALLAIGWLLGPAFGNAVFGLMYRGQRSAIEAKEREFFTRIKKHRVDPTNSSIQNPVPDYYGEKIGSVADYRRWLKDQRAYNLKRGKEL